MYVSHEFDLGEVEIDFISFVLRGANRKKYFLVKEDRLLKEDILKSILEENTTTKAGELHNLPVHSLVLFQTTSFIVQEFD